MLRRPALAAAAVAAAVSGCGVGPHHALEAAGVQSAIASQLSHEYPVAKPAVACPGGVPLDAGRTFHCTATVDGQPLQLDVTLTDSHGHFRVEPSAAIIPVARATAQLEHDIAGRTHSPASLDCGSRPVLVVEVGGTFACSATVAGVRRTVRVTEAR